jgi:predicted DNA-binding transcriptional regulator AlpA
MSRNPKPAPASDDASLDAILADLQSKVALPARLTWRKADLAAAIGISERTIERELSAGRFPRPDLKVGKMPLWTPETIRRWVESGGAR